MTFRAPKMNKTLKLRLAVFIFAIVSAVLLILWAAHDSWQRAEMLRVRLTTVQWQSFRIADGFQQSIQQLNNLLLRSAISRSPVHWAEFDRRSRELDTWIDEQRPHLTTEPERLRLDAINAGYNDYMHAARQIEARIRPAGTDTTLAEFSDFEQQSERLLNLGFALAREHQESLSTFLHETNRSLVRLQILLLVSLCCLLLLFSGLAVITYRGLIAPLQLKLIETQALIERNEKLASLGLLAAGVAHEIRNPLTAIKARLFTLQKRFARGTPNHDDSDVIAQEINRLERIVKDVLHFARPGAPQFEIVEAGSPLREVELLLKPTLEKNNIQLLVETPPSLSVRIDPAQIKQVLINLVQNAADSIGAGGTIRLRVRSEARRLVGGHSGAVILEVIDTGRGIPPDVQKRLFDPFFSTKDAGTGLGLAIASRIVEKHGGALQYQTEVHHGTTFGIVLPCA